MNKLVVLSLHSNAFDQHVEGRIPERRISKLGTAAGLGPGGGRVLRDVSARVG
jgi:hypothetical protein